MTNNLWLHKPVIAEDVLQGVHDYIFLEGTIDCDDLLVLPDEQKRLENALDIVRDYIDDVQGLEELFLDLATLGGVKNED